MNSFQYFINNWKLGIHLLFRTYRFGVNNEWWVLFDSIFGLPIYQRWHLIKRYKEMRFRSQIGFISEKNFKMLFSNKNIKEKK